MFRLLDFLENTCFFDTGNGGGGGASDTTEPDDDKENKDDKEEEKITLTKAEYEEKLKQKFAEGARKAQQGKLGGKKDDTNENKDKANNTDNDILSIKQD